MSSVALKDSDGAPSLRLLGLAFATYIGFVALGYGGVLLSGPARTVSLIWPSTAFAVVMMVRFSEDRITDLVMLGAVALGELMVSLANQTPHLMAAGFCVVTTCEVLAGVVAIRHFAPRRVHGMGDAFKFGLIAMIAPCLVGAGLAEGWIHLMGRPTWRADGIYWFSGHVLAFCVVLPFGLNVSWRQIVKLKLGERWLQALVLLALLVGVSLFAMRWLHHPLAILIVPVALAATVRFRLLGATVASFVVVAVVYSMGAIPADEVALIQVFLGILSVITARSAVFLNERDMHLAIIERKRRRAVHASRFKNRLLAQVSGEARGPLTAIIGFSGILESGELSPDRAQEFAHIVAHNGELLQRLYGDLLDFNRAEADDLSIAPEKVEVVSTLKSCISAIRQEAALGGKPVVIDKVDESLMVHADPQRLGQILNNLIANSYKYGDNHSPIRVRASRLDDHFGRIEISNSGPGIPIRERDAIFKPFGAERGGRQVPGAILGLSIAKLLAEKQGGRIDFESIPGRQTRFWIDLPLAA